MIKNFFLSLDELQPSQLYINEQKLVVLNAKFPPETESAIPPIPVKQINGEIIYTDGHTRAFLFGLVGFKGLLYIGTLMI